MDHDRYSNAAGATRSDQSLRPDARGRRAEALPLKRLGGELHELVARAQQAVDEICDGPQDRHRLLRTVSINLEVG